MELSIINHEMLILFIMKISGQTQLEAPDPSVADMMTWKEWGKKMSREERDDSELLQEELSGHRNQI